MIPQEIPPTAGLPLRWQDFLPPWQTDFAARAAALIDAPYAGLECSGTASMVVILSALARFSARKTVVIPAFTCPLVVFAIAHCGMQVRLCDLAPNSFELDAGMLATICDEDTLAIVPTHLAGRVAQIAPVQEVARPCGAYVIEDAAQAFGARQAGQSLGLAGDAGFFSFAAGKGLSLYEGGLWITANPELARACTEVSQTLIAHQPRQELRRCVELAAYAALYRPSLLHFAYGNPLRAAIARGEYAEGVGDIFAPEIPLHRVSAWRRAVGSSALKRLPDFHAKLAAQARRRCQELKTLGLQVFEDGAQAQGVWPTLLALMPSPSSRDAALSELWGAGLGVTRMFVEALPDYAYLQPWLAPGAYPNARDFAARSFTLSNSLWLDDERFARILTALAHHIA